MSWNNRVCKETKPSAIGDVVTYSIREVYYANKDQTKVYAVTQEAIGVATDVWAEDVTEEDCLKEIKETVERFAKALEKPIIDLDNIEYAARQESD